MEKDKLEEQQHFADCRQLIEENIHLYEAEVEERHRKTQELFRAIQGGDVELYNQMMTSASLEEHAANQLRKNRAAYDNPYFGRIDYYEEEDERENRVYIGKNGVFRSKTDVIIADWRAPISSVYYGVPVREYNLTDEEAMYKEAMQIITKAKEAGYGSIAVICKDKAESDLTEKWRIFCDYKNVNTQYLVFNIDFLLGK